MPGKAAEVLITERQQIQDEFSRSRCEPSIHWRTVYANLCGGLRPSPEKSGYPVADWTHAELADKVQQRGIVAPISSRHLDRLFNEADRKPHCVRYWLNAKE